MSYGPYYPPARVQAPNVTPGPYDPHFGQRSMQMLPPPLNSGLPQISSLPGPGGVGPQPAAQLAQPQMQPQMAPVLPAPAAGIPPGAVLLEVPAPGKFSVNSGFVTLKPTQEQIAALDEPAPGTEAPKQTLLDLVSFGNESTSQITPVRSHLRFGSPSVCLCPPRCFADDLAKNPSF